MEVPIQGLLLKVMMMEKKNDDGDDTEPVRLILCLFYNYVRFFWLLTEILCFFCPSLFSVPKL